MCTHTEPNTRVLSLLQSNPSIVSLDLSDHHLSSSDCGPLFQALQGQQSLASLSLSGNRLKDKGIKLLTASLAGHTALHLLDLSCTAITAQVHCMTAVYVGSDTQAITTVCVWDCVHVVCCDYSVWWLIAVCITIIILFVRD